MLFLHFDQFAFILGFAVFLVHLTICDRAIIWILSSKYVLPTLSDYSHISSSSICEHHLVKNFISYHSWAILDLLNNNLVILYCLEPTRAFKAELFLEDVLFSHDDIYIIRFQGELLALVWIDASWWFERTWSNWAINWLTVLKPALISVWV